eukprot:TRINITY_DN1229_c0_g1_i2.p2 TRINITY_DN1229_c0_g1~~TRINITY_DN1229_c0_g1_i2.p2  ORF type:complete len:112 (-),score=3.94 TRINITY_DN1229_c0_g1_i2:601-936(-)
MNPNPPVVSLSLFQLLHNEIVGYAHSVHPTNPVAHAGTLERIGKRAGEAFVLRVAHARLINPNNVQEVLKFVCRDFWVRAFSPPAPSLKTNHRGMFIVPLRTIVEYRGCFL